MSINTQKVIDRHLYFVKSFSEAKRAIYEADLSLFSLQQDWKRIYGNSFTGVHHFVSETYLPSLLEVVDQRHTAIKIPKDFLLPSSIFLTLNSNLTFGSLISWQVRSFFYAFLLVIKNFYIILLLSFLKTRNLDGKTIIYGVEEVDLEDNSSVFNFGYFLNSMNFKKGETIHENALFPYKSSSQTKRSDAESSFQLHARVFFFVKSMYLLSKGFLGLFLGNKLTIVIVSKLIKAEYLLAICRDKRPKNVIYPIHSGFFITPEIAILRKINVNLIAFEFSQSYFWSSLKPPNDSPALYSFYSMEENQNANSRWSPKLLPSEIWAYDEFSKKSFQTFLNAKDNIKIKLVGSINISDSPELRVPKNKADIAIFGIQDVRGLYENFYANSNVLRKFYEDINEILKEKNIVSFVKAAKGEEKLKASKVDLKNYDKFLLINNIAPRRLIDEVDLVICFPFTSPAFIAKNLNKSVIFYDPIGIVDDTLDFARDIPLIHGKDNLSMYIDRVIHV
tara:strand:- start:1396 stop:2913 length:1518 start_codon:yes stop_codon:yes gene_type:complete